MESGLDWMNRLRRLISQLGTFVRRVLHIPSEVEAEWGEVPVEVDTSPIPLDPDAVDFLSDEDDAGEPEPIDEEDEGETDDDVIYECMRSCFGYVDGPFNTYEDARQYAKSMKNNGYIYQCGGFWWVCDNS